MIRLQSRVHGDVLLLDAVATIILNTLGKDIAAPQGIIRVETLSDAIAKLELSALQAPAASAQSEDVNGCDTEPEVVSLRQRLQPVLAMLRHSQREGVPVLWTRC